MKKPKFDNRTFRALLEGEIEELVVLVRPSATCAKRKKPFVGLWNLNREQFQCIAENIIKTDQAFWKAQGRVVPSSLDQIAYECDLIGIKERFFSCDKAVAAWLDDNDPQEINADYILA